MDMQRTSESAWTDFDMHDGWRVTLIMDASGLTFDTSDGPITIPLPDIETVLNFIEDSPYKELLDRYYPVGEDE